MTYRANLGCLWLLLLILIIGGMPLLVGLLRLFAAFTLVALVAGVSLSWWIRRNAVVSYVQSRSARSRRFVELLVGLLVRLAEIDGQLDRREVTAIRHFFQYGLGYRGERLLWIRDLIKESRERRPSLATLCTEIRNNYGLQERLIVLQVLGRIGEADGRMGSEERRFIEDVARRLGVAAFAGGFQSSTGRAGAGAGSGPGVRGVDGTVEAAFVELGLARGASPADIKQAWRALSMENHPDRVAHLGEEFQRLAEDRMRRINAAYDVLKGAGLAS